MTIIKLESDLSEKTKKIEELNKEIENQIKTTNE